MNDGRQEKPMNSMQAGSLKDLIRENSFRQLPSEHVKVHFWGEPHLHPAERSYMITIDAPGYEIKITEDNEHVRMMLIALCCDLGKMIKSSEYDNHIQSQELYQELETMTRFEGDTDPLTMGEAIASVEQLQAQGLEATSYHSEFGQDWLVHVPNLMLTNLAEVRAYLHLHGRKVS